MAKTDKAMKDLLLLALMGASEAARVYHLKDEHVTTTNATAAAGGGGMTGMNLVLMIVAGVLGVFLLLSCCLMGFCLYKCRKEKLKLMAGGSKTPAKTGAKKKGILTSKKKGSKSNTQSSKQKSHSSKRTPTGVSLAKQPERQAASMIKPKKGAPTRSVSSTKKKISTKSKAHRASTSTSASRTKFNRYRNKSLAKKQENPKVKAVKSMEVVRAVTPLKSVEPLFVEATQRTLSCEMPKEDVTQRSHEVVGPAPFVPPKKDKKKEPESSKKDDSRQKDKEKQKDKAKSSKSREVVATPTQEEQKKSGEDKKKEARPFTGLSFVNFGAKWKPATVSELEDVSFQIESGNTFSLLSDED